MPHSGFAPSAGQTVFRRPVIRQRSSETFITAPTVPPTKESP
ncbi:hypothetical protein [Neisseria mucosa]|nr:hypothetical protein [Neisseria mucosa]KJJ22738.1 hypothetical protein HMPREF3156_00173 [Neisseria sp. HMSC06F02]